MPNKGFFINAQERTITEVEIDSWEDISPMLDCEMFTTVVLEDEDTLYVDDEGLLKPCDSFILYDGYAQPLAGNGLVLGSNYEGETTEAPKVGLEDLKARITFLNRREALRWAEKHAA